MIQQTVDNGGEATPLKKCPKCGEWKSHTKFNKDKGKKDGLTSQCKECEKERGKIQRKRNTEKNRGRDVTFGPQKKCPGCGKMRPRIEFYKQNCRRDGLSSSCKECEALRDKKRYKRDIRFLYGIANQPGFLNGDGCCMWCFEANPFMLNNHHVWGRKNSRDTFTFCENHHAFFSRGYGKIFGFLADL